MMEYISNTYIRGVKKYNLVMFVNLDYVLSIKKIIDIEKPFIIFENSENVTILDKNFYILEYVPFDKNYICRIHLNEKKEIIERFYVVTKNNRIIYGIPVFDSLKLSYVCYKDNFKIYNEDVINNMLNSNIIDLNDYNSAFKVIEEIKNEISNNSNYIYNLEYSSYLNEEGL